MASVQPPTEQLNNLSLSDASNQLQALAQRQLQILQRITALENMLGLTATTAPPAPGPAPAVDDADASPVQKRLQAELLQKGIANHRFVRAPPEYYDRPLQFRQSILNAHSVDHLCKTIIMENTRVEPGQEGVNKYYMVIVQYTAKLHSDKLRNFVHAAHGGLLPKSKINMRLCAEEISDALSGFEHNAVSPIGIKTPLPIIMSHKITQLQPDYFWLGAGEVDLKVGLSAAEFVVKYEPNVVDCTYDG